MFFVKIVFMILISFFIGGYSTTDILRLTKGNAQKQLDEMCRCPICGYVIQKRNQIPILSYVINFGKCKNCNGEIPKISFLLEVIIPCSMILISILLKFSPYSFVLGFLCYELIKVITILIKGKQKQDFLKRNSISLVLNVLIFSSCFAITFMIQLLNLLL